jgi:hypothetical protein
MTAIPRSLYNQVSKKIIFYESQYSKDYADKIVSLKQINITDCEIRVLFMKSQIGITLNGRYKAPLG